VKQQSSTVIFFRHHSRTSHVRPRENVYRCGWGTSSSQKRVRRSRTIQLKRIDSDLGRMELAGPPHPPKGITGSPTIPTSQTMRSKSISICTGTVSSGTPNQRAARRPLTITKPQHKLDLDLFFCSDFLHQATYT
jgi:hypothetical protein